MNLKDLVAVSGMPGLYRMAGNRGNGLILENIDNQKRKFFSARKYQFTPLETIAIYTYADSIELGKVFSNMVDQYEDNPPASPNSDAEVLREYFTDIIPDFDQDRVSMGDIKKVIKWFNFLYERGFHQEEAAASEEEE